MADAEITKVSILGKDSIRCGFHLVQYIVQTVLTTLPSSTYALITDTTVAQYHLKKFQDEFATALKAAGSKSRFIWYTISPGETSKSRQGKADIEDYLLAQRCTRDTVVLALGGGVIGDLVGFVAATFMRGLRFVQIPTTLLAMVDSSVGGKTAIDTPHGKNLIGAFWQPEYVFVDAAFLETLPPREFANGMAEVIKTAAIWDEASFASLESRSEEVLAALHPTSPSDSASTEPTASQRLLLSLITGSIHVKAHIVTLDERETGLRNLVNFGHTIGHAIEAVLTPAILHGECVAIGMILEAEVARALGVLSQAAVGRLARTIRAYGLPTSVTDPTIARVPASRLLGVERLLDIMRVDKKNSGPEKRVVLLSRIGKTYEERATPVADEVIRRVLCSAVKVICGVPKHNPVRMATPGSKSVSNRVLLMAALGSGTVRLKNLLHSDDTQVMMNALIDFQGAEFSWEDGGETLVVKGNGGNLGPPPANKQIYLGNAGTAARFLTTVCALVQASPSSSGTTTITGNARMKQRPIGPLVDALRSNGVSVSYLEAQGSLPLEIGSGGLRGGRIELAASVSSQYVSSVLLCAPYAAEPVELALTGGVVISQPYIDMTIALMAQFGVRVRRRVDDKTGKPLDVYDVPQGAYVNPADFSIESDASSATYPLAVAAITGTTCTIENIGSVSVQGDAQFAKGVLERMGCTVVQTESETTVTGPPIGQLKAIGEVDMEPMTDAFLTASVLAAVAAGKGGAVNAEGKKVTRIVGIANQRVKECNRIQAMIDQLAKLGVETKELDDGLEIYAKPIEELKQGTSIHCYDDHRVAMAFSVLGAVVRDTIIEEKRCVEKTWPNWWDDLENKIGLKVDGIELPAVPTPGSSTAQATQTATASVVLIGMRGSGKTFIGELAAQALGWSFLDADAEFEVRHRIGVREFVHERGWPAFRAAETALLKDLLKTAAPTATGHVISLGGGIVETPGARNTLKEFGRTRGPVVHIVRDIEEIVRYLGEETARPAYGEPVEAVARRREPWFAECSTYEFVNNTGVLQQGNLTEVAPVCEKYLFTDPERERRTGFQAEVVRFFQHITGVRPNLAQNVAPGKRSYFLSLTYPDITPALSHIDTLTAGVDAIELRVDLLRSPKDAETKVSYAPPVQYVVEQLTALRQRSSLPVVFTVRTVSQGGSHPDNAEEEAFSLIDVALRTGCEYIDAEISWPEARLLELNARKGHSQIIASWHDWSGRLKWDGEDVQGKYALASSLGDIVKIVGKAMTFEDNFTLRRFAKTVTQAPDAKPLIAINTGYEGQLSRVLNSTFSPVTHPRLAVKAAPGQLSFAQIQQTLHTIGDLPAKRFFLFGTPIAKSPSPTLHNTGFQELGLPYRYALFETDKVDDRIRALLKEPDFGGASVTIPHKVAIIPLLDELSEHAKAIGAVNTVIPRVKSDGTLVLVGDNTDWLGILNVVKAVSPLGEDTHTTGLVIGAGGTSRAALYALHKVGLKRIYLFNRTRKTAEEVAAAFPSFGIEIVDRLDSFPGPHPTVVVSTVPGTATTAATNSSTALSVPSSLFRANSGVAVDMAYMPRETPLLSVASSAPGWQVVYGVQVLLEQGYHQFADWIGRSAPRSVVAEHVRELWLRTTAEAS